MIEDKSWASLLNPGDSDHYFNDPPGEMLQAGLDDFNVINAWWLAELSRLIYRLDNESRDTGKLNDTSEILSPFGSTVKQLFIDEPTSTYSVLFQANCKDLQGKIIPCDVISFCGSNDLLDWKINIQAYQDNFFNSGKVHSGFLKSYLSIREQLLDQLNKLEGPVFITGHSLGAALATLVCADLELQGFEYDTCYTFGSPRVGDATFTKILSSARLFRVINNCDVVTTVPVSLGKYKYLHSGLGCFFGCDGSLTTGLNENEISQIQRQYIPSVLNNLSLNYMMEKFRDFGSEAPSYMAEHAPVNYSAKLTIQ